VAGASSTFDVATQIAQLWVYPIKSCAGVALQEAVLMDTGLDLDRAWMVVDQAGAFVTQRALPRMALVQPQFKLSELVLRAPGMLALHLSLDKVEQATRVRVWDDEVAAYDMGDLAAQWFSDFLGQQHLRLVRFDPEQQRLSSKKWTGAVDAPNQFSDGFPVLVLSQGSLDGLNQRLVAAGHAAVPMLRFRPNIVLAGLDAHDEDRLDVLHIDTPDGAVQLKGVKPCPRCPIPNIDPATGQTSPEVGDTLQGYRQNPIVGGGLSFGMNAVLLQGLGHTLRLGQTVQANYRFD
jgi:uncharacterized protein YcbX